jgi:hypothetical protein
MKPEGKRKISVKYICIKKKIWASPASTDEDWTHTHMYMRGFASHAELVWRWNPVWREPRNVVARSGWGGGDQYWSAWSRRSICRAVLATARSEGGHPVPRLLSSVSYQTVCSQALLMKQTATTTRRAEFWQCVCCRVAAAARSS